MKTELAQAMLQIEGDLFKLSMRMDKETSLNNYCNLVKERDRLNIQLSQYSKVMDELMKQERLASIKRKMLK